MPRFRGVLRDPSSGKRTPETETRASTGRSSADFSVGEFGGSLSPSIRLTPSDARTGMRLSVELPSRDLPLSEVARVGPGWKARREQRRKSGAVRTRASSPGSVASGFCKRPRAGCFLPDGMVVGGNADLGGGKTPLVIPVRDFAQLDETLVDRERTGARLASRERLDPTPHGWVDARHQAACRQRADDDAGQVTNTRDMAETRIQARREAQSQARLDALSRRGKDPRAAPAGNRCSSRPGRTSRTLPSHRGSPPRAPGSEPA